MPCPSGEYTTYSPDEVGNFYRGEAHGADIAKNTVSLIMVGEAFLLSLKDN